MMILLTNAQVFDGLKFLENGTEVLVEDNLIKAVGMNLEVPEGTARMDLGGRLLSPAFIDLHGHFRDPGQTWREDIKSGSRAAAAGGFGLAVAMPNTDPPLDSPALIRYVRQEGAAAGGALVLPAGCVSFGRQGQAMAELGAMAEEGAVLFTDDGSPVLSPDTLLQAILYSSDLGIRIMEHPEEPGLTKGAHVHEGRCSAISGIKGQPEAAEVIGVQRGIALAKEAGFGIHLTHLSTAGSILAVRRAKADGLDVTCDITPHHLVLSEEDVLERGLRGVHKVNPPLRSLADVEALWGGLADGTVDAIGTDHAPYHVDEKDLPLQEAAFGIASYECAAPALFDRAASRGLDPAILLKALTSGPAGILPDTISGAEPGLGLIEEGRTANLTVIDETLEKKVDTAGWRSKARMTPYQGMSFKGWPVLTMVRGRVVFDAMEGSAHA